MTFPDFTDSDPLFQELGRHQMLTLKPYGLLRNSGPLTTYSLYFSRGSRVVRCDGQKLGRVLAFCWDSPVVLNYDERDIIDERWFDETERRIFKRLSEAFTRKCAQLMHGAALSTI